MEFLAARLSLPWEVWVLTAPKALPCIPIVTSVAIEVRNKCEMFCLV